MDKIYTRRGDEGWTELLGGRAVAKTHPQVEAYGTIDELTANLGLAATMSPPKLADQLMWIQERLFVIGAILAREDLSAQGEIRLSVKTVEQLERWIDELQKDLPRQTRFLMPGPKGGSRTSAQLHVARTVCRRAERRVCTLEGDLAAILMFLNRLSDYLYAAARWLNFRLGVEEYEMTIAETVGKDMVDGE